jgi:outer membrane protein assembly factor BamB
MQTHKQETAMKAPVEREIKLAKTKHTAGVTHDGKRLWAANADGDLIAVDPINGKELARYRDLECRAGLAFDGECLWAVCGKEIKRIDPETGKVRASIPSPVPGDISGMAFAEGYLWLGQWSGKAVLKIEPKTGKVLKKIARDRFVTGVSFVDGEVWHASSSGKDEDGAMLHRLDPESLEERERYPLPMFVSGLEIDPTKRAFWAGGGDEGNVRLIARPQSKARG